MMYNVCNRHPLVCVSRLMVALQLYIIQQRVSLVCAKFRICSFIVRKISFHGKEILNDRFQPAEGFEILFENDVFSDIRVMGSEK